MLYKRFFNAFLGFIFYFLRNDSGMGFHPWERRHPGGQRTIATRIEIPLDAFPAESYDKVKFVLNEFNTCDGKGV